MILPELLPKENMVIEIVYTIYVKKYIGKGFAP